MRMPFASETAKTRRLSFTLTIVAAHRMWTSHAGQCRLRHTAILPQIARDQPSNPTNKPCWRRVERPSLQPNDSTSVVHPALPTLPPVWTQHLVLQIVLPPRPPWAPPRETMSFFLISRRRRHWHSCSLRQPCQTAVWLLQQSTTQARDADGERLPPTGADLSISRLV
jgi:hypothetical protein